MPSGILTKHIRVHEVEIENLLQKGAIVLFEHEKEEYISPIFTTPKKDWSSRMILFDMASI